MFDHLDGLGGRMSDADIRDASGSELDWKHLAPRQRATFDKVIKEAFVPDLIVPTAPSGRACA